MFDEMMELPRTTVDLLASGQFLETDWRGWYDVYLEFENFVHAADSLLQFLESGPESSLTSESAARYVNSCNDAFSELHIVFLTLLRKLFGLMRRWSRSPGAGGIQAHLISHHCHPKSYWMIVWEHVCFTGRVSADAARLDRQALHMHPSPAHRLMESDIYGAELYRSTSIDVSNAALRSEAVATARASLGGWIATHHLLRQILRERCTIGGLVP